jgi:aryl-alcohol dehydrogenase-like predicted oxidoreductase
MSSRRQQDLEDLPGARASKVSRSAHELVARDLQRTERANAQALVDAVAAGRCHAFIPGRTLSLPALGRQSVRRDQLAEALGAVDVELSAEDLEAIEHAVPRGAVAGDRYHVPQMATLDSELGRAAAG